MMTCGYECVHRIPDIYLDISFMHMGIATECGRVLQGRAGQGRAGQGRAGQDRAENHLAFLIISFDS